MNWKDRFLNKIVCADCVQAMKEIPENSIDAIVTDPPYGLEFMGEKWDKLWGTKELQEQTGNWGGNKEYNPISLLNYKPRYYAGLPAQQWHYQWAKEVLRVLKPGGFLLAFGGSRTYHRLTCAIEDAGFEVKDTIMWIYATGMPKSLDISKAIDKHFGAKREVIGKAKHPTSKDRTGNKSPYQVEHHLDANYDITTPVTPEARKWVGFGTSLKPMCEPIVVAKKPISEKNIALNVLKWKTGGLNIDESRIPYQSNDNPSVGGRHKKEGRRISCGDKNYGFKSLDEPEVNLEGRWPANLIIDKEIATKLDQQSGISKSAGGKSGHTGAYSGGYKEEYYGDKKPGYGDVGGVSRFFYVPKPTMEERNMGIVGQGATTYNRRCLKCGKWQRKQGFSDKYTCNCDKPEWEKPEGNVHPTIKPLKLMEYLIKLVMHKGGICLDPFAGSGTTLLACIKLNFDFIGIEKEKKYCEIAEKRFKAIHHQFKLFE